MTPERALPIRVFLRVGRRLIVRLASGAHRASDDAVREDLALLPERLDQIDAWIEEGLLNGEELNAADFQIAPNVSALLLCDDLVPLIAERPTTSGISVRSSPRNGSRHLELSATPDAGGERDAALRGPLRRPSPIGRASRNRGSRS